MLLGITGPLAGRVVTGNADGFRSPTSESGMEFVQRWAEAQPLDPGETATE